MPGKASYMTRQEANLIAGVKMESVDSVILINASASHGLLGDTKSRELLKKNPASDPTQRNNTKKTYQK